MQEKNRRIDFVKARPPLVIVVAVGIFLFGFIVKAVASLFHLHGA